MEKSVEASVGGSPSKDFNLKPLPSFQTLMDENRRSLASAREWMNAHNVSFLDHSMLLLVDLQGIYLNLVLWLQKHKFPIESGTVVSRFAVHLLNQVIHQITADIMRRYDADHIDLQYLLHSIENSDIERVRGVTTVVKFIPQMELFYAPVLLRDIERDLRVAADRGGGGAKEQFHDVKRGIVHVHGKKRDYSIFQDFISGLSVDSFFTRSEAGFYSYRVEREGVKYFDEKEVDIRLAVRGMEAAFKQEVQSLCIVSSDQDFMPLHERCRALGMRTYHADAANFSSPGRTGSRIKQLPHGFIKTEIDPLWPMRIIIETSTGGSCEVSQAELEALSRIHNNDPRNSVKISPIISADGTSANFRMYRPG